MSWASLIQGQLLSDGSEQFPHILGSLGGGLEEQKSGLAGVRFGLRCGNGPLVGLLGDEIELVACQGDDDVLVGLALELLDPCLRLIQGCLQPECQQRLGGWLREGVLITTYSLCDIVDDHGAVRIPVVHGRQRLVSLLPGRVPDFKFHCRVLVERDGLCEEGGANSRFSVRVELVLAVCQWEGR